MGLEPSGAQSSIGVAELNGKVGGVGRWVRLANIRVRGGKVRSWRRLRLGAALARPGDVSLRADYPAFAQSCELGAFQDDHPTAGEIDLHIAPRPIAAADGPAKVWVPGEVQRGQGTGRRAGAEPSDAQSPTAVRRRAGQLRWFWSAPAGARARRPTPENGPSQRRIGDRRLIAGEHRLDAHGAMK